MASKQKSKSKVRIPVRKGTLGKFGYKTHFSDSERRQSLKRAAENLGAHVVLRKLNAVAVLQKNTNPRVARILIGDRDWIRKVFSSSFSTPPKLHNFVHKKGVTKKGTTRHKKGTKKKGATKKGARK